MTNVQAGSAATAAAKPVTCSGNRCILDGMNATPIPDGTIATLNLSTSSTATGNLAIQLQSLVASDANGSSIPVSAQAGSISIPLPMTISLTPASASLSQGQSQQFGVMVSGGVDSTPYYMVPRFRDRLHFECGLYSAPATISAQQTVTVIATSVTDPSPHRRR